MANKTDVNVAIPVLNEAGLPRGLLRDLLDSHPAEIIVADGGSTDGTQHEVQGFPSVKWSRRHVAGVARCVPPSMRHRHLSSSCFTPTRACPTQRSSESRISWQQSDVVGGCFRLAFDRRSLLLDLYSWLAGFESRFTTFGDQAFFVRRTALESIGGVPPWPFLEDVELRARLVATGRFVKLEQVVTTSARRFDRHGAVRGQIRNGLVLVAYHLGFPIDRLARFYGAAENCD